MNFLVGGTQKGGTTALDAALRRHPQIRMALQKEVHFFDSDVEPSPQDYPTYHANFDWSGAPVAVGESTPIYMYWLSAPQRVFRYNRAMKWVLLLRNPIDRAYSGWNMERTRGNESLPFRAALMAEADRRRKVLPLQDRVHSYVDRGLYTRQIRRLLRYFPRNQLLILRTDQFDSAPLETLGQIWDFLGVASLADSAPMRMHVGRYDRPMSTEDRMILRRVFESEFVELEQLLGWSLDDWRYGHGS